MKLINTALFTPRNIVVVSAIALAVHFLASPVYKMIDNKGSN